MFICAAAVKFIGSRGVKIITGASHADCLSYACEMGTPSEIGLLSAPVQGFITSEKTFVNRQEAYEIAKEKGQLNGDACRKTVVLQSYMLDVTTVPEEFRYMLGTGELI